MTQNQIAYHNAVELKRHNMASEEETQRHQKMQEALQNVSNAISKWQVAVNNAHYTRMDAETERANRARENQNLWNLQETVRSNVANEQIRAASNRIQSASVAETSRHQKAMESIQSSLNDSIISRNYAETEYTGARTVTESYRPSQIINEIDLTNSSANLNRERLGTEKTQQFRNITSSVGDVVRAGTDIIKMIAPIVVPSGSSGGSNLIQLVNSLK